MNEDFQVFISYARPDQEAAVELYEWLKEQGLNPWMDLKHIKGGQNWDFEIKRALDKSAIVIVLWSNNSRDRRGYIQRELKISLNKLEEKLVDDIFIIPVLIGESSEIPEQLKDIHCLSSKNTNYKRDIADAISHQMERLGAQRQKIQKDEDLYWQFAPLREEWDGIPGYAVEIELLDFTSETHRNVSQVGQYLRGEFLEHLFSARRNKLEQSPAEYNYAQDKWSRTHTFDAHCGAPVICGKVITLNYAVSWYGAGAAHPVHAHKTFSFLLSPLFRIESLSGIFTDSDTAFSVLQQEVRNQLHVLLNEESGGEDGSNVHFQNQNINEGTSDWDDFSAFVFNLNSLDIYFSSYQVAAYAAGTPSVEIPYKMIAKLIRDEYVSALGIQRFTFDYMSL